MRLDIEEVAGGIEDLRVGLLPGQIGRHEHAVKVAAHMQLGHLLPLRIRGPVGDEGQGIARLAHAQQQLDIVSRNGQVAIAQPQPLRIYLLGEVFVSRRQRLAPQMRAPRVQRCLRVVRTAAEGLEEVLRRQRGVILAKLVLRLQNVTELERKRERESGISGCSKSVSVAVAVVRLLNQL